jgi:hypothetical protein
MLTDQDFEMEALIIGCKAAAIKAVTHQEAGGKGFYADGRVIIKFEGHIFHHFTQGKYSVSHPTLSYPKWTEKYTQEGELAYVRFNAAYELDPHAAMMATSWGMFQIMGENYSSCGFKSVDDFVTTMHMSEQYQLAAFVEYCHTQGLDHYLINMATPGQTLANAAGFALRYNGKGYKDNHYDTKIANNFVKFSQQS